MKAAVAPAPAASVVTKTTTITTEPRASMPDFWDYLETEIPRSDPHWDKHLLYIYRQNAMGPSTALGKFVRVISVPGQQDIPLDDKEAIEWGIRQVFGGGNFRLILKRGSERITEGKTSNDAPQKAPASIPEPNFIAPASSPGYGGNDPTAAVAQSAIHAMQGKESEAMRVAVGTLEAAASVVKRLTEAPPAAAPTAADNLTQQFMAAMMQRALNPPDQLETFARMMALMKEATSHPAPAPVAGGTGIAGVDITVGKILETGLERILNPAPVAAPGSATSVSSELVRSLPMIGQLVVQGMQEWRAGMQAQAAAAAAMAAGRQPASPPAINGHAVPLPAARSAPPPGTILNMPPPASSPPSTILSPESAPAPPSTPQPGGDMTPPLVWIESRLIEFLRTSATADEAAEKFADFLELSCPELTDKLVAAGKESVATLFQSEPVLREGTIGMPPERIQEFINKFFACVTEAPGEEPAGKPN
jgi:hypothetical protein